MNSGKRLPRHGLSPALVESWEDINPLSLPEEKRQNFSKRALAIRLYAAGESIRKIEAQTGIKKQQLFYFAKRCTSPKGNGTMLGFVAIIPGRQNDTNRTNDLSLLTSRMPKPGALAALFEKHPDIHTAMKEAVLEGKRKDTKLIEKSIPLWSLHQYFLNLCAEAGIRGPHYPFCSDTDSDGKPAIYRWVKKLRTATALSKLQTTEESALGEESLLELEQVLRRQASIYCYRRVECDGHKIDVPIVLERPSPTGEGVIRELINRIWIIALIEAKSDAAIGYALAIGANYSGTDVIRAVESSLKPWSPKQLTIKSIGYRDGDGIPNGIIPELAYVCFDELWLDNFMAQRSEYVLSAIERVVSQDQLQGIHEKHAREIALLQSELGDIKLKLGSSEGILQEMRSRNLRLEEQLQAARSLAEVARTQEIVAKKELDLARAEISALRANILNLETTKEQQEQV